MNCADAPRLKQIHAEVVREWNKAMPAQERMRLTDSRVFNALLRSLDWSSNFAAPTLGIAIANRDEAMRLIHQAQARRA